MVDAQTPDDGPDPTPREVPPTAPDVGGGELASKDDRNLAVLSHILGIFTWLLGALIIWLIKKEDSAYVDDQGKEAINFQITIGIAYVVGIVIPGLICFLMPVLCVANVVLCVLAAVAASKGERYRYPLALRLVR